MTNSLDAVVALRLDGPTDLLLLPEPALPLLAPAALTLSALRAVAIPFGAGEADPRACRMLFDAGLVRIRVGGDLPAAVFLRSDLVRDLDWLEFGEPHRVSYDQLGQWGRFANQAFQTAHTVLYGLRNQARPVFPALGLEYSLPQIARWCTGPTGLPRFEVADAAVESALWAVDPAPVDIDFTGYFQNPPALWQGHRALLRRLLSLSPKVEAAAKAAADTLRERHGSLLAIHVRRGDYVDNRHPMFRTVPSGWLTEFIGQMRAEYRSPAVYVATDDEEWVLCELGGSGICTAAAMLDDRDIDRALFDFAMLRSADIMGCANSSFSRMAALLAEDRQIVYLPSFYRHRYERYDPWTTDLFWEPFRDLPQDRVADNIRQHRVWLGCLGLAP